MRDRSSKHQYHTPFLAHVIEIVTTVTVVHFLDLRDRAVRGLLHKGQIIVSVHAGLSGLLKYADLYEVISEGVILTDTDNSLGICGKVHLRNVESGHESWRFAGDMGLWDIPGVYRNEVNYVLDPEALLEGGISVGGI